MDKDIDADWSIQCRFDPPWFMDDTPYTSDETTLAAVHEGERKAMMRGVRGEVECEGHAV